MVTVYVDAEFDVLVPEAFVPCQYHTVPLGGVPRVKVDDPQSFDDTHAEGSDGLIVTKTDRDETLQQPVVLFLARK